MRFVPLASSSHGNAYLLEDGATQLLIECGVSFRKLQKLLQFSTANLSACLISHEHKDHAGCYSQLMERGVPIFTSLGTAEALEFDGAVILDGAALEQQLYLICGLTSVKLAYVCQVYLLLGRSTELSDGII